MWIMYVWFPLHSTPPLILESQIPPTMKNIITFFATSYIGWLLIVATLITLCLSYFAEFLTLTEFLTCFIGLWLACGLIVAYFKDM